MVLFAFPSRYWFTIGRSGVFSLGGWSPHVQTGFHVPRPTHFSSFRPFRIKGCHLLWPVFPDCFARTGTTFGLLPVRSSLLGESRSGEPTSEPQSLMRISYYVFCL